jgi:GT2 family glycosyltransferase
MPPGWITKVMTEFDSNKALVALSGPYIYYDLSPVAQFGVKVFYIFGFLSHILNQYVFKVGAMLQGGNFVVRRDALTTIGGFDTRISFYGEDTDIARRISRVGKVKWTFSLPMYTSGRRLQKEGLFRTGYTYAMNYLWSTFFKRPFSEAYTDFR